MDSDRHLRQQNVSFNMHWQGCAMQLMVMPAAGQVQTTYPVTLKCFSSSRDAPAVSIMSSTRTATLSFTSPIRFMTSLMLCALRRLSTIASGASFSFFANARARATPPTSGETTTWCRPKISQQYVSIQKF